MDNKPDHTNTKYVDPDEGKWHAMSINELKEIFNLPDFKEEIERGGIAKASGRLFDLWGEWGTKEYRKRKGLQEHISYINYLIKFKEEPIEVRQSKRERGKETNIYLMVDRACGMHKIGRAKNVNQREKTLGAQMPKIEFLFSFEGFNEDEKELHSHFCSGRGRGEWFDLSDDDINYIKNFPELKKQREYIQDAEPKTYSQWLCSQWSEY